MAKLYFQYSTMNAGKSTLLLQASHNYQERGMDTYLITAGFDKRAGEGKIGSRIGIASDSDTFESTENMFQKIEERLNKGPCSCVFIDEAQFLSEEQEHSWEFQTWLRFCHCEVSAASCSMVSCRVSSSGCRRS